MDNEEKDFEDTQGTKRKREEDERIELLLACERKIKLLSSEADKETLLTTEKTPPQPIESVDIVKDTNEINHVSTSITMPCDNAPIRSVEEVRVTLIAGPDHQSIGEVDTGMVTKDNAVISTDLYQQLPIKVTGLVQESTVKATLEISPAVVEDKGPLCTSEKLLIEDKPIDQENDVTELENVNGGIMGQAIATKGEEKSDEACQSV
eukprot:Ihof_evm6s79 gene=Ihof_evmTU6s79